MSPLYRRTLLVSLLTLLGLFVLVYLAAQLILVRGFEEVERRDVENNMERVRTSINDQVQALNLIALGWSKWDDVRDFVKDQNQQFIDVNLVNGMYIGTGFEQSIWLDPAGKVVYTKAVDVDQDQEIPISPALLDQVKPGMPLVNYTDVSTEITGLLKLPEGLMMVSSLPVLNSVGEGPINGGQVWGQYIKADEVARLSETTRLDVTLTDYDAVTMPADFAGAKQQFQQNSVLQTVVLPENENMVAGFSVLNDIYGKPVSIIRAEMPRPIFQQGQSTIQVFLLTALLLGLAFVLINLTNLDLSVLRRVASLSKSVDIVRETDQLKTPIRTTGNDEIGNLGRGMRAMLDQVAESRARLNRYNQELEQRVAERTHEMSDNNAKLVVEVAERQQAQQQAAQARDQAIAALQFRTQILANVSHDSRTPLTAISLQAELIQKGMLGEVNPKQHEMLGRILISSRQLLTFINNMLSEAQLNAGKLTMNYIRFAPEILLDQVTGLLNPIAERKGLTLLKDIDPAAPKQVSGDPDRLKQILNNLVDNAIKFTSQGSITLRVRPAQENFWALQVQDTGHGIGDENRDHIFEPFYQIDGTLTRETNRGVGLGLSIVKQLVEALGGTVTVDTALNRGTTFTVTLPVSPLHQTIPSDEDLSGSVVDYAVDQVIDPLD